MFRFQQVYSASLFHRFLEGVNISFLEFRPDRSLNGGFSVTVHDVEIHLSTTSMPVDGLSPNFDLNVGRDDRIVRTREPFGLSGLGGEPGPSSWMTLADFRANPFYYNPTAGNLLVDIKVFGILTTTPFDAIDEFGDSVSSLSSMTGSHQGPGLLSTKGLATSFVLQPIPEPRTITVLALAVFLATLAGRKGLHRKGKAHRAP